MKHSLKYNFTFNVLNSVVGLLFPLITFPYVSRILEPDGVGVIQYCYSIIGYISMLCTIGIPIYAVREIARCQHDTQVRNRMAVEILALHVLLTFAGYIVVALLILLVPSIGQHAIVFLIISTSILLNAMGVTWFFQAIEDFRYITLRSLLVRIVSAILLFTLVKSKEDLITYAVILVLSDVGNNLFNLFRLRKFINREDILVSELKLKRHVKPALKVFVLNIITSIYINLDSVMLGAMSTLTSVGYYAASIRITRAVLGVVSALGVTVLPRMAGFVTGGDMAGFMKVEKKAIDFVLLMTIPMSAGLIVVAPLLIPVFSGNAFSPAIPTLQILAPTVLFIGISTVVGMQVLYSQGKEKLVIISTAVGAMINVLLNLWLIPVMAQNGAAIGTVVAEFIVTTVMLIIGRKYIHYNVVLNKTVIVAIMFTVISIGIAYVGAQWIDAPMVVSLILLICTAVGVYLALLHIVRNELMMSLIGSMKRRLKNHGRV